MALLVSPLTLPDAWDYIDIGGNVSPGPPAYIVVSGADIPRKLDVRDGMGQDDATTVFVGKKVSDFLVTLYLVEDDDWDDASDWIESINEAGKAYKCAHPALAFCGISALIIESIGQPEPEGELGLYKIPIKCKSYGKPRPALKVPDAAFSTSLAPPQTEAEKQIAKLTAQVNGLAEGS